MSKEARDKIQSGIEDAIAFKSGDKTRGRVVGVISKARRFARQLRNIGWIAEAKTIEELIEALEEARGEK